MTGPLSLPALQLGSSARLREESDGGAGITDATEAAYAALRAQSVQAMAGAGAATGFRLANGSDIRSLFDQLYKPISYTAVQGVSVGNCGSGSALSAGVGGNVLSISLVTTNCNCNCDCCGL